MNRYEHDYGLFFRHMFWLGVGFVILDVITVMYLEVNGKILSPFRLVAPCLGIMGSTIITIYILMTLVLEWPEKSSVFEIFFGICLWSITVSTILTIPKLLGLTRLVDFMIGAAICLMVIGAMLCALMLFRKYKTGQPKKKEKHLRLVS